MCYKEGKTGGWDIVRHGERRLAWGKEEGLVPLGQEVECLGLGDMGCGEESLMVDGHG